MQNLKTYGNLRENVCNEYDKGVISLMNKELLKLTGKPLAHPSVVFYFPITLCICHSAKWVL